MSWMDIGASVLDAGFSAWSADKKEDFDSHQAYLNRDWQERMSNTAYQRTVQDLNAAGLSPMLAYSKGGASTPGGATASAAGMPSSDIAGGVQKSNQRSLAAAQESLTREQEQVAESQKLVNIQTAKQVAEQAKKTALEVEQMPARFYYDLAVLGSQVNSNTAGAIASTANARNTNATADLTEEGKAPSSDSTITRTIKDAYKFGIETPNKFFNDMIGNVYKYGKGKLRK